MSGKVVCLDMAGTTVADQGLVLRAFRTALRSVGVQDGSPRWNGAVSAVSTTMGQSKIDVFRRVLADATTAVSANAAFEAALDEAVTGGQVEAVAGAEEVLAELRSAGFRTCLTTGFAPATRDAIIDTLGWHDAAELALSPADVGRGRPWPDLIWAAALRLEADSVADITVVGDTTSDMQSGKRAGAGLVIGVCSGANSAEELTGAGADCLIDDITGLRGPLGLQSVGAST